MRDARLSVAPHARQLLDALGDASRCATLDEGSWDGLVRTARAARLLGTLAARIGSVDLMEQIPEAVARHLRAALAEAHYLRQMSLRQLSLLAETLAPLSVPIVALKGSAYILSGLSCAEGRLPRDIDLMVESGRLDEVERTLRAAGWTSVKPDPYDQRYYREWSHELPPMRAPTLPLELDLHHSILPPIGRLKPDAARLIGDSVTVAETAFRVLRPADLLLHAVVHLFQDSDCVGKLRDLVDIDALARDFSARHGGQFWAAMLESASLHGLGRPLWYALHFCGEWLGTPMPDEFRAALDCLRPPALPRGFVVDLVGRVLPPVDPDAEAGPVRRGAAAALELRALWLRMPPWLLAYHAANKLRRSITGDAGRPSVA